MRSSVRDFVLRVTRTIPAIDPVYEFGSFQVAGQEQLADLRSLFRGRPFVGCDMRPGRGVDRILDLHDVDLPDASVGTVLCLDTLEHVEYCRKAVDEMYRILTPNGALLLSSVLDFPIHDYPCDYWRFTPQAFKSLLNKFETALVWSLGPRLFPHTVIGLGLKGTLPDSVGDRLLLEMEQWETLNRPPNWKNLAKKILPPLVVTGWKHLKRQHWVPYRMKQDKIH